MSGAAFPNCRRRPWRQDAFSLAAAALCPLVLTSVFPFEALHRPAGGAADAFGAPDWETRAGGGRAARPRPLCAFVELTAADEARLLAAARAAWQTAGAQTRRKGPDMFAAALPADAPRPVIAFDAAVPSAPPPPLSRYAAFLPPTDLRAPAPAVLPPPPPAAAAPAFSRADLLQLK